MHTAAELEAKARKTERWRRPLFVALILTGLFNLAVWEGRGARSVRLTYLVEHGWPASTPELALLALTTTLVASSWLEWRISRLADAIARARTVADISGNPNARVGVLGESDPRCSK